MFTAAKLTNSNVKKRSRAEVLINKKCTFRMLL